MQKWHWLNGFLLTIIVFWGDGMHSQYNPLIHAYAADISFADISFADSSQAATIYNSNALSINKSDLGFVMPNKKPRFFHDYITEIKEDSGFTIRIYPLADFSYLKSSRQIDTLTLYNNTRGLYIEAQFKDKFYITSGFEENQSIDPVYIQEYVNQHQVYPSKARVKPFKTFGYDYAVAYGQFTYKPHKQIDLSLGNGKSFIGFSHRSLFLSDFASPYPFMHIALKSKNKKWHYSYSYNWLGTMQRNPEFSTVEAVFIPKNMSVQLLSYTPIKPLSISIINTNIWSKQSDSKITPAPLRSFQPLPVASMLYSSKTNACMGLDVQLLLFKTLHLYGQVNLNKHTDQMAFLSGVKTSWTAPNFYSFLRAEFINIPALMYTHSSDQSLHFDHFNQALAHPLGRDLQEFFIGGSAKYNRLGIDLDFSYINTSSDSTFLPLHYTMNQVDLNTSVLNAQRINFGVEMHYDINPKYFFRVFTSYRHRSFAGTPEGVFSLGLKSTLFPKHNRL